MLDIETDSDNHELIAELIALESELAKRNLYTYVEQMWPQIEPATPFVGGFHLGAVCEHEQAVFEGQIEKLAVNICPRSGKSICTSIAFPTWGWTRQPSTKFLCASYSADLALELATTARSVVESAWYQERFEVQLAMDQNNKSFYRNTNTGYRISTSVGGSATGKGGDILIVDDPHNLKLIESEVIRSEDIRWFLKVWSTRLNNKKRDRQIVIMQRGHEDDLMAALLEQGDWCVLKLPTEYTPTQWTSPIGWSDPRTTEGQLLSPERIGPEELAVIKRELGPMDYSAQHGQNPLPEKGGMFERSWFEVVRDYPRKVRNRVRFWDAAGTESADAAYTAGTLMSEDSEGVFYVEDVQRARLTAARVDALIKQTAQTDGVEVEVVEEQEPGSAGKAVIAARKKLLAGYAYHGVTATGEKSVRWKPLASQSRPLSEADAYGNVKLVEGEWNKAFLDEVVANRRAKYKDQLDSAAGALHELRVAPSEFTSRKAVWG
tara:strand:- start:1745 stop:3220 length:1476 start_codon:yes stop_codon:yes gene_type:complete